MSDKGKTTQGAPKALGASKEKEHWK